MSEGVNRTNYKMSPTLAKFHADNSFVRLVRGPIGSGKSVAGVLECIFRAIGQEPIRNVRRSRGVIIRSTYPDLIRTTMKTFKDWVAAEISPFRMNAPIEAKVQFKLPDGTEVVSEIEFLALDRPSDVRKLDSLELTYAFCNELRYLPENIFQNLRGRLWRYPSKKDGGASWSGMFADTNPPSTSSWIFDMVEKEKPENLRYFVQPPAILMVEPGKGFGKDSKYIINPLAENVANQTQGADYWLSLTYGSSDEYIRVMLQNQYGSIFDGKPVYDHIWNHGVHVAKERLPIHKELPIWVGWDFGLTPACVIVQMTPRGEINVLREIICKRGGIRQFVPEMVKPILALEFRGMQVIGIGDPAGAAGAQNDITKSCFSELKELGLPARPASTDRIEPRLSAVQTALTRMVGTRAALQVDPSCEVLIEGFNGAYNFAMINTSGSPKYQEKPNKTHPWSDAHDALGYILMEIDPYSSRRTLSKIPVMPTPSNFGGYV